MVSKFKQILFVVLLSFFAPLKSSLAVSSLTSANISSTSTRLCLNIPSNSTANGAVIIQWTCSTTAENEIFSFVSSGSGVYHIVSALDSKCLDVSGSSIIQNTCSTSATQNWVPVVEGGYYEVKNNSTGSCLTPGSGDAVTLSACSTAIVWKMVATSTVTATPTPTPTASATPTPTPTATVLPAPTASPTTSWLGNSLPGILGSTPSGFVQDTVDAAYVYSDGTVFTNSSWDEGGQEAGIYKGGANTGQLLWTHGSGRTGGGAITADASYVYMAISQNSEGGTTANNAYGLQSYPAAGTTWYMVRRYTHAGAQSSFGGNGDGTMLLINTSAQITGLAAGGGKLYVADPASKEIKIYNTASNLAAVGSFAVSNPGPLAYDSVSGTLWMIEKGTSTIVHYSTSGTVLSQITVSAPTALAVGANGDLYVADNGPDQDVKIYTGIETTPKLSTEFGTVGGQYANGEVASTSFGGLTGVGTDSSGNIYITMNGMAPDVDPSKTISTSIRSFTSSGVLNWNLYTNEFVSAGVIDPTTNGEDVYTKNAHYKLDLTKAIGSQATYVGVTQNPLKYPNDMRNQLGTGFAYPVAIRYIDGKKFMFDFSMYQNGMMIFRFDGETAIPSGWLGYATNGSVYPPNHPSGYWIWRDTSGDGDFQADEFATGDSSFSSFGMSVDSRGDIWAIGSSGLEEFPPQGIDSVGNPIYTLATMKLYPKPTGYSDLERVLYIPETDTMYLGGYLTGTTNGGYWGAVGAVFDRYNNFTTAPKLAYRIDTSFDISTLTAPKTVDVAGDAIFMQDESEKSVAGPGICRVYDSTTGALKTSFYPGAAVGGTSSTGWTDIPYGLHAYELENGRYLIFLEDDVHAKIIMYYW